MIGGSFLTRWAAARPIRTYAILCDFEMGYDESFDDSNLWVEPKSRDGVRNRSGIARLIGGATPGPGNVGLLQASFPPTKAVVAFRGTGADQREVGAGFR